MIIVNGWEPLTVITKCSILDVAGVLDPPLKLASCFTVHRLYLPGLFIPIISEKDGYKKWGRFTSYICEDIQSKLLISKSKCNIETLSVAVNLRKRKWFLNCSYNPNQNSISNHLECLNRLIDEHPSKHLMVFKTT